MPQMRTVPEFLKQEIPRSLMLYYGIFALWLFTTAMHIPDGYLSPVISIIMFIIVLPFWIMGVRSCARR